MGCYPARILSLKKSSTISSSCRLNGIRELIISQIYYLHSLNRSCKSELESCVIQHDNESAFLIKQKQICVKQMLKDLQELIGRIDECLESIPINSTEIAKIENLAKGEIEKINKDIVFCSKIKVLRDSEKDKNDIKKDLKKFKLNEKEVKIEILHQMQVYDVSKKGDNCIRYRYVKSKTSI